MDISVIIIGFGYTDTKIPSILFDIYKVYSKFDNMGYKCYILTDIHDFRYNKDIYQSISCKKIDKGMIDFIAKIKKPQDYYLYTHNIESFKENINSIKNRKLSIIYYTGHGLNSGIKFPSNEVMQYNVFRNYLVNKCDEESIIIMDCCYASNMKLNYQYMENVKYFRNIKEENFEYGNKRVLVIASSDVDEKSAAIKYSSLFTKYLVDFLNENQERSFCSLIQYINSNLDSYDNKQNVKVYSSIPIYPIIPSFLFIKKYFRFNYLYSYIDMIC